MKRTVFSIVLIILLVAQIVGCTPAAQPTAQPTTQPTAVPEGPKKLKVFGAFATPIEEPWDGVIHSALLKLEEEGKIDYEYTENIGYSGDMERILQKTGEQNKPK